MADNDPRTIAAILADINCLGRTITLYQEAHRMGHPGAGEHFSTRKMHEQRAELLRELAQHEPARPHRLQVVAQA